MPPVILPRFYNIISYILCVVFLFSWLIYFIIWSLYLPPCLLDLFGLIILKNLIDGVLYFKKFLSQGCEDIFLYFLIEALQLVCELWRLWCDVWKLNVKYFSDVDNLVILAPFVEKDLPVIELFCHLICVLHRLTVYV